MSVTFLSQASVVSSWPQNITNKFPGLSKTEVPSHDIPYLKISFCGVVIVGPGSTGQESWKTGSQHNCPSEIDMLAQVMAKLVDIRKHFEDRLELSAKGCRGIYSYPKDVRTFQKAGVA